MRFDQKPVLVEVLGIKTCVTEFLLRSFFSHNDNCSRTSIDRRNDDKTPAVLRNNVDTYSMHNICRLVELVKLIII